MQNIRNRGRRQHGTVGHSNAWASWMLMFPAFFEAIPITYETSKYILYTASCTSA